MSTPRANGPRTRRTTSRENTPQQTEVSDYSALERRRTPRKKALPEVQAHTSNAYGASARATLAQRPQDSVDVSGFASAFDNQRKEAPRPETRRQANEAPSDDVSDKRPSTIAEEDEGEAEEEQIKPPSEPKPPSTPKMPRRRAPATRTTRARAAPAAEAPSMTFNREDQAVLHALHAQQRRQAMADEATAKESYELTRRRARWGLAVFGAFMVLFTILQLFLSGVFDGAFDNFATVSFSPVATLKDLGKSTWSILPSRAKASDVQLSAFESSLNRLTAASDLHESTLRKLEEVLPDSIVLPKNIHGGVDIPDRFWQALKHKMEDDYFPSIKTAVPAWGDFFQRNQEKLERILNQGVEQRINHHLSSDRIISKEALMHIIQNNYATYSDDLRAEMEQHFRSTAKEWEKKALTSLDLRLSDKLSTLPAMQLSSIADANLIHNARLSLTSVNFFSASLGAVVDPYLTSPTYTQPAGLLARMYARLVGIRNSHPPVAALEPWQEAGDCWCAAASVAPDTVVAGTSTDRGGGTAQSQIGILIPRAIYPEFLTVEHVPSAGTLDIGAAPQDLELWVEVLDAAQRAAIRQNPDYQRFIDSTSENKSAGEKQYGLPDTFVRIANAQYDIHGANHVQAFRVQFPLQDLDIAVRKAVVRITRNHGQSYTCIYRLRLTGKVLDSS